MITENNTLKFTVNESVINVLKKRKEDIFSVELDESNQDDLLENIDGNLRLNVEQLPDIFYGCRWDNDGHFPYIIKNSLKYIMLVCEGTSLVGKIVSCEQTYSQCTWTLHFRLLLAEEEQFRGTEDIMGYKEELERIDAQILNIRQARIYLEAKQYLTQLNAYLVDNKFPGRYSGIKGYLLGILISIIFFALFLLISSPSEIVAEIFEGPHETTTGDIIWAAGFSLLCGAVSIWYNNKKSSFRYLEKDQQREIIDKYISCNPPSNKELLAIVDYIKELDHPFHSTGKYDEDLVNTDILCALSEIKMPVKLASGVVLRCYSKHPSYFCFYWK